MWEGAQGSQVAKNRDHHHFKHLKILPLNLRLSGSNSLCTKLMVPFLQISCVVIEFGKQAAHI